MSFSGNGRVLHRPARRRGISLAELLLSMGLFGMLMFLMFSLFQKGVEGLQTANARYDAERSLNKAQFWLRRDLEQARAGEVMVQQVALPDGGDAIWFLSAIDPTQTDPDLKFIHDPTSGAPVWQTNILYYLAKPTNYGQVSGGLNPLSDPDPTGDFYAPHKFLIRKVINDPASDPETLLSASAIGSYITNPDDYRLSTFSSEANLVSYRLIADKLLSFQVGRIGSSIELNISAVHLEGAGRKVSLGNVSLKSHPLTRLRRARIELRN